jgi:predicted PhzF superfamily epimerase YddE/YHI9
VTVPLRWVDAFSNGPFTGNPAGVCVVDEAPPETWMQQLAFELGIAETAFVVARGGGEFDLRWFTPVTEIDLCGHATLAAAHVLREDGHVDGSEPVVFHTRSGALPVSFAGTTLTLDFPAAVPEQVELPASLRSSCAGARECWRSADLMVVVESRAEVEEFEPDLGEILSLPDRALLLTGPDSEVDFVLRFFAPAVGIDEDPATGSAQCLAAPYWAKRLGKDAVRSVQLSARRGYLGATVRGDRVLISGEAVTVLKADVTTG